MINGSPARKDDKISVSANDIAQQRQALKKAPKAAPSASKVAPAAGKKRGRPKGTRRAPRNATPAPGAPAPGPMDLIDRVFDLANDCGGMASLKRLVDRIAEAQRG